MSGSIRWARLVAPLGARGSSGIRFVGLVVVLGGLS